MLGSISNIIYYQNIDEVLGTGQRPDGNHLSVSVIILVVSFFPVSRRPIHIFFVAKLKRISSHFLNHANNNKRFRVNS